MFIKIIFSLIFIGLSFLIYRFDKKRPMINLGVLIVLIVVAVITYRFYNSLYLNKTALVLSLLYSIALILLMFIMKGVSFFLGNRYKKLDSNFIEKYRKVTNFLKREAIVVLITIYQLLIIWYPSILGSINF